MIQTTKFNDVQLYLASPETIRDKWSSGEVKEAETINFRTHAPEENGLLSQRIFGPIKDYECACGRYKRIRYKGIICEKCGVEVVQSVVRKDRMGHVSLQAPVVHYWFFRNLPSRIGNIINIPSRTLEKVAYYSAYLVTEVDTQAIKKDKDILQKEVNRLIEAQKTTYEQRIERRKLTLEEDLKTLEEEGRRESMFKRAKDACAKEIKTLEKERENKIRYLQENLDKLTTLKKGDDLIYNQETTSLLKLYKDYFKAYIGAEAIIKWMETLEDHYIEETKGNRDEAMQKYLKALKSELEQQTRQKNESEKDTVFRRLQTVNAFIHSKQNPKNMIMTELPIIPPDMRPMVELDSNRFTTSDINELYRKIIIRNNRLRKLVAQKVPDIILNYERRDLQESVDSLFETTKKVKTINSQGTPRKQLKSLSDSLRGKRGRFRMNLLGKRVDFSGRSVIVVGPSLKIYQCGLPKEMALELFKPWLIQKLFASGFVNSVRMAKAQIDSNQSHIWPLLEEAIRQHPVLLNRAPTLHRLGIQAFEPVLVEGKAIQLHPLTCAAFNADFDGDQMAVHVPLTLEAQTEARILMASNNNIIKPSDGKPITLPSQDMIVGIFSLTRLGEKVETDPKKMRHFSSINEAVQAYDMGDIALNDVIRVQHKHNPSLYSWQESDLKDTGKEGLLETTYGRLVFNKILPQDYPYINKLMDKKVLTLLVNDIVEKYKIYKTCVFLDALKDLGFHYATTSGMSIAFSDITTAPSKEKIISKYEKEANQINENFKMEVITEEEKKSRLIEIWGKASEEIGQEMETEFTKSSSNTLNHMVGSGARGNWMQVRQIAAMRGLVAGPTGEIIPRPIKSNYYEGLSGLEYFIASHGARKGLADTALKTADSGYLTRRLVDVAQDVVVRDYDCKTNGFAVIKIADENGDKLSISETTAMTRCLAEDVKVKKTKTTYPKNTVVTRDMISEMVEDGIKELKLRTISDCKTKFGVCVLCYGQSLSSPKLVDKGESVGIIAAQSIGEPGTQLTLRTFHSAGAAAADDITQGLPRVSELFESRHPRGEAPLANIAGKLSITETTDSKTLEISNGKEKSQFVVSITSKLKFKNGDEVKVGDALAEGPVSPKELMRLLGRKVAQKYVVDGIQEVYRSQGVDIHDKHIEVIVREMSSKVLVFEPGDSKFEVGEYVDELAFRTANKEIEEAGSDNYAIGRAEMLGITRASLVTYSWLSAASFQETSRVLTQAAIEGKKDHLVGVKENVLLGKLIPAGTGLIQGSVKVGYDLDKTFAAYPGLVNGKFDYSQDQDVSEYRKKYDKTFGVDEEDTEKLVDIFLAENEKITSEEKDQDLSNHNRRE